MIGERAGQEPAFIPIEADPLWAGIDSAPQSVAAQALEQGRIPPILRQWRALKKLQRFALVKLSRGGHENENFLPALDEFGLSGILEV